MNSLIPQLQLLLAALSAFLPLVPADSRAKAADILDVAAKALAVGDAVAANIDELAQKLAAVRAEIEALATAHEHPTPEALGAALSRVLAASAAFRAALETAEASR